MTRIGAKGLSVPVLAHALLKHVRFLPISCSLPAEHQAEMGCS